MHDVASIEGAPLDKELAQKYFDALPERARAFLDRLEKEAARNRVSREAQLQACDDHGAELAGAEARRDAFKRGMREGSKEDVARLAVHEKRVADGRARLRALESVPPVPSNIEPAAIMSCVFKAGLKPWGELQVDPPELHEGVRRLIAFVQARPMPPDARCRLGNPPRLLGEGGTRLRIFDRSGWCAHLGTEVGGVERWEVRGPEVDEPRPALVGMKFRVLGCVSLNAEHGPLR